MTSRSVLLYLLLCWLTWAGHFLEWLDLLLELLLNVHLLVVTDVVAGGTYETAMLTVPYRGGASLTMCAGSYR